VRETVLVPFLWLQARAEESNTSRARFARVEAERDSAAWDAQALPALRAENDRLRALLGITARLETSYHPAEVLRQSQITDGRTLVLSAGKGDGVAEFDAVVSPEGVIGMVIAVERATSVAMTWAHPDFRVSAATEDGSLLGIISTAEGSPDAEPLLELHGVPYRDTVAVGTLVVTTGLGGIYPRGVPIGRVLGVAREQKGWERVYEVRPAANLGATGHVLILSGVRTTVPAAGPTPAPASGPAPAEPPRRRRPSTDSAAVPPGAR
ncbi:MAG TPA: rod shape-determining protein MreC, partial [Gemmatimonadales bacterium]|nr:rod shape-determining protein MreC [Gemmatimonadales bacterium]